MAGSNRISLRIRDARPEELDELSLLIRDAYQEYERLFPSLAWKSYIRDIMDVRSRLGIADLIVADLDGWLVGAVTLYLDASRSGHEGWPAGWATIRILAVHSTHRRRGAGSGLMEECLRRCRDQGVTTVGLHTTEAMGVARRMYERMGFIRMPEFDFHPDPTVVVMAYRLVFELSAEKSNEA